MALFRTKPFLLILIQTTRILGSLNRGLVTSEPLRIL